jgi:hypothetical protein
MTDCILFLGFVLMIGLLWDMNARLRRVVELLENPTPPILRQIVELLQQANLRDIP